MLIAKSIELTATTIATNTFTYTISTTPSPLKVNTTASISIVAANSTNNPVTCTQIQVIVPQGTASTDLTPDPSTIAAIAPANWTGTPDTTGTFTFKPNSGSVTLQPNDALGFVLSGINVNDQVGTASLSLQATVNQAVQPSTLQISKFPAGFVLSELEADPLIVNPGGQTILTWTGSEADYKLVYATSVGSSTLEMPDQTGIAIYTCPVGGLDETTIVTLMASVSGGTVQVQRQCVITVPRAAILDFNTVAGQPHEARVGSTVKVYWQTQNAISCDLLVNGLLAGSYPANVAPTQGVEVSMPSTTGTVQLFLRAYGASGGIATTATLPLLAYQFMLPSSGYAVGVSKPFQLVPSVDGSRLYVVGNYPQTFPTAASASDESNSLAAKSAVQDSSNPVGYLNLKLPGCPYTEMDLSAYKTYPIAMNSDTTSVSRLALRPGDARYLYWATPPKASGSYSPVINVWYLESLAPDISDLVAVVTGANNKDQVLAVKCSDDGSNKVMVGTYRWNDFSCIGETDITAQLNSGSQIWNITTNSTASALLITTSLNKAWNQNLYRYDVSSNSLTPINLPNCCRSANIPSYVAFSPNDQYYYVSGIKSDGSNAPVIAVVNAADNSEAYTIPMPAYVRAMVASPDAYHLYATLADNSIVRINTGINGGVVDTLTVGSSQTGNPVFWGIAINLQGTQLYVTDIQDQKQPGMVWAIEISDGRDYKTSSSITFQKTQTDAEIQELVSFLTQSVVFTADGTTDFTVPGQLPLSFYSTPDYWGEYVCSIWAAENNQDCTVLVKDFNVGQPDYYRNGGDSRGTQLQLERVDATAGTDIYDAACWQIALALVANQGLPGVIPTTLFSLCTTTTQRLGPNVQAIRGNTTNFQYGYKTEISDPSKAYALRLVGKDFWAEDPFWGNPYQQRYVTFDSSIQKEIGSISWPDWKPITGENAWAFFEGPLQADYLQYKSQGYVPFSAVSIQNALYVLYAFDAMQTPIGAFYYAPGGSDGNDGPIPQGEISVENCISSLAGLIMFKQILESTLNKDTSLATIDQARIKAAINLICIMVWGGQSMNGQTDGLLKFLRTKAWNASAGVFCQGGTYTQNTWTPTTDSQAVDVSTWGLTVLGPQNLDQWFGAGTAFNIWQNVKQWGSFSQNGQLWGVGYSSEDNNAIMSAEWTAGAINAVRCLMLQYQTDPVKFSSLQADHDAMMNRILNLRSDKYVAASFPGGLDKNAFTHVNPPSGQLAFLYASKRYNIPFGWYSNPIPSTTSTSWTIYLHYDYNPFQLGGSYFSPDWKIPAYDPTNSTGPWDIKILNLTLQNNVDNAQIRPRYLANSEDTDWQDLLSQPIPVNGSSTIQLPMPAYAFQVISQTQGTSPDPWQQACQLSQEQLLQLKDKQMIQAICTDPDGTGACLTALTLTVQNKVDKAAIIPAYIAAGDTEYTPLLPNSNYSSKSIPANGSAEIQLPLSAIGFQVVYQTPQMPPNNWYQACLLNQEQVSQLKNGQTIDAIWTNDTGSGACQIG